MTNTVIVPAALLPPGADPDPYETLRLPGLERLLRRASIEYLPGGVAQALASAYGLTGATADVRSAEAARHSAAAAGRSTEARGRLPTEGDGRSTHADPPLAPCAVLGEALSPAVADGEAGYWAFATPIQAALGVNDVALGAAHERLPAEESAALLASLTNLFADDGLSFHVGTDSGEWYLHARAPVALVTRPLPAIPGGSLREARPGGDDAPAFLRYLSEIEMLLHAHPVNEAREGRGEARVDGIWLWGGGAAIAAIAEVHPLLAASPDTFTDDALVRAIARGRARARFASSARGIEPASSGLAGEREPRVRPLADAATASVGARGTVVFDDTLRRALLDGGTPAWRTAFADLDRRLFAGGTVQRARPGIDSPLAIVLGGAMHAVRIVPRLPSWLARVFGRPFARTAPSLAARIGPLREPR